MPATGAIASVDPAGLPKGNVELAKVGRQYLLHKVRALGGDRVQISNNHGHVNGWASRDQVYGIVSAVDGVPTMPHRRRCRRRD